MPQVCQICASKSRSKIESAILSAQPLLAIATKFSVSRYAVTNHKQKCLAAAVADKRKALSDRMFDEIEELHSATRKILTQATQGKKASAKIALAAIGEARRNIELVHKLVGPRGADDAAQVTWEEFAAIYARRVTRVG